MNGLPRRPNVVLFVVDDMGWMDCGAYGSQYYETPNVDRLAARGMSFTDAYAASPLCSPSRASMLTGKYPARLGITAPEGHWPPGPADDPDYPDSAPPDRPLISPHSRRALDPAEYTLPQALRDAGYRTAHIGKWHLGGAPRAWPQQHGFDVAWHGSPDPGPPRPGGYFAPYSFRRGTITPGPPGEYIVDRVAAEGASFIEESGDQPFFLNMWQFGVHGPWDHKERYTREFAERTDPRGVQGNPIMASMLRSVDESLGTILATLEAQGLTEDTLVVFTSDHGGNVHSNTPGNWRAMGEDARRHADWMRWAGERPPTSNAPLRDGKGSLYEGGVRVPLIVAWPGHVTSGRSHEVVMSTDFYPTLLDLAGLAPGATAQFDGISFASVLGDPAARLDRAAVFNFQPHDNIVSEPGVSVRRGDWKLIRWFAGSRHELYDLQRDLGETTNRAAEKSGLVEELDALIDQFLADTAALLPIPNPSYRGEK